MDTLASTTFRKTYASLQRPTVVTVSGHPIGTWYPAQAPMTEEREKAIRLQWANAGIAPAPADHEFNSRPFTPAPRTGDRPPKPKR